MRNIGTDQGLIADPDKVRVITEFSRFIGMVNYLFQFVQNMSSVNALLRELIKQDSTWHWEQKNIYEIERFTVHCSDNELHRLKNLQ